ncbi:endonuclease MutS2 [Fictibacillus aquaticus]|uniref:endonuclease MutS2 n=1 Tax=Fictibacillus aquaticus TaxID=2021314 RepID=UPI0013FDE969|nr:MutS2/Smr-associated SH3 domain-containing protein [Fictibacillus aquaticus]
MNTNTFKTLEFNKILEKLSSFAMNDLTRKRFAKLKPSTDEAVVRSWLSETSEAAAILEKSSSVPIANLNGIENLLRVPDKGLNLSPEQLWLLYGLLENAARFQRFMRDKEFIAPTVSTYAYSMFDLSELKNEIERCIRNNRVDDGASKALAKVRKRTAAMDDKIKSKLESLVKSSMYRDMMQDQIVSMRDGRYVIPVKSEHKRHFDGTILDSSSSGATVYMEPQEIKKLQTELNMLRAEEEIEISKILGQLTDMVVGYEREISITMEAMVHYDFIFAKAKYSRAIDGAAVKVNTENRIIIHEGRHPLLGSKCVPLHFRLGEEYGALVITGPNTGGKTVAIKTVGLMTLMVQSGLHVPVGDGSEFAVYRNVLVDIGDNQSIEQSLSTFSAHITNIISILQETSPRDLVILDELGAGTDPVEGMALAVAILEKVYSKGSSLLATTHYSEIKEFAEQTPGFENGSMAFDLETLRPLYRLTIGKAGASQAFAIASKLGMSAELIERAKNVAGRSEEKTSVDLSVPDKIQQLREKAILKDRKPVKRESMFSAGDAEKVFEVGDRVHVSSMNSAGVIFELENDRGEYGVQVDGKKVWVQKKRLSVHIKAEALYPKEYDMDIVFETKENRKKDKQMKKRHVDGMSIEREGI